ncbi:hypothetical protein [Cellulomonas wangsupingiae]|uniref:MFS transporter n=2 Tax=Cellulomonas wangsupingiae TaxID=2968085 RepID=A0ABY5K5F4_9CELL|nr:hypothetical protein [Cellulomonas wangsupingiae]MCC2334989.1 hypothetical protein [Cellulomonas wangsupingiae]MCM0638863.1 hypothetical protein [Cellulomonas wangsupingiae]UUI65489.1 hypothetical protein NP075_01735 [Cellulomonas wangsupingiae]
MSWPWRVLFALLLAPLALCVVLLLVDATNGVNGTFDSLGTALLVAASVGVVAVLLVNVALYRAGRSRPTLRRVHGWAVLVVPVALGAWYGIAQALEPEPRQIVSREEVVDLVDRCQVRTVRWTHGTHYDVDTVDGARLHTTSDVEDVWAARRC